MYDIAQIGRLYPKQISIKIKAPVGGGAIVKAGTPINANGEVTLSSDAVGLLRYDCNTAIEQIGVVIVEGVVDTKKAQEHAGITYTAEVMSAIPGVALTGIADVPGGGTTQDIATDAEVNEALDDLFQGHK